MNHNTTNQIKFQFQPEEKNEIEVLEIVPATDRGNLKAFASVRVGEFLFSDCRIIQQPNQSPWFTFPQLSYKDNFGTQRYKTLITIRDPKLKELISRTVIGEWEKSIEKEKKNGRQE